MCVKEFLGYNCGHCSVPTLRKCPLSASNPYYPACEMPAERPIFTNEYCHPCSRVVWNEKVLKEEEEHRNRHLAGECMCAVVFEGEDQKRHLRPRGRKGKGKGENGSEQGEADGHYRLEGNMNASGSSRDTAGVGAGGYMGYLADAGSGEHARTLVESGGHDIEEHVGMQMIHVGVKESAQEVGPSCHESAAQGATREYAGYYNIGAGGGQNQGSQGTTPVGPTQVLYNQGQLAMGQDGAGMKYYPFEHYSEQPAVATYFHYPTYLKANVPPRAASEPIEVYDRHARSPDNSTSDSSDNFASDQPAVVSSDMTSS